MIPLDGLSTNDDANTWKSDHARLPQENLPALESRPLSPPNLHASGQTARRRSRLLPPGRRPHSPPDCPLRALRRRNPRRSSLRPHHDGPPLAPRLVRRGDELPDELQRREQRLATIQEAKQRLEAQAKAAAEALRQQRAAKAAERERTGQKRRGQQPGPIDETPDAKAQTNFTDPELRI